MPSASDRHAEYDKGKLFVLSVIALVTAGVSFSLRSSIAEALRTEFFDPINKLHSAEMIGGALGVAFLGFAFTIAVASPILDNLGIGRVLQASEPLLHRRHPDHGLRRRPRRVLSASTGRSGRACCCAASAGGWWRRPSTPSPPPSTPKTRRIA